MTADQLSFLRLFSGMQIKICPLTGPLPIFRTLTNMKSQTGSTVIDHYLKVIYIEFLNRTEKCYRLQYH